MRFNGCSLGLPHHEPKIDLRTDFEVKQRPWRATYTVYHVPYLLSVWFLHTLNAHPSASRPAADRVIAISILDAVAQPLGAGLRHRGGAGFIGYRLATDCRRVQIRIKYLLPCGENPLAGVAPAGRLGTVAEEFAIGETMVGCMFFDIFCAFYRQEIRMG